MCAEPSEKGGDRDSDLSAGSEACTTLSLTSANGLGHPGAAPSSTWHFLEPRDGRSTNQSEGCNCKATRNSRPEPRLLPGRKEAASVTQQALLKPLMAPVQTGNARLTCQQRQMPQTLGIRSAQSGAGRPRGSGRRRWAASWRRAAGAGACPGTAGCPPTGMSPRSRAWRSQSPAKQTGHLTLR